jgi:alpha-mannosidase
MTIFTDRASPEGTVSPGSFIISDNPDISILTCKAAEDGGGYIVRLWNFTSREQQASLRFPGLNVIKAEITDISERNCSGALSVTVTEDNKVSVRLGAGEILNLRVELSKILPSA